MLVHVCPVTLSAIEYELEFKFVQEINLNYNTNLIGENTMRAYERNPGFSQQHSA